jgi:hypothetical protein
MQKYQPTPATVPESACRPRESSAVQSLSRIIVGANAIGTSFRILLDGLKLPVTLHVSYIELEDELQPSRAAEPPELAARLSEEART